MHVPHKRSCTPVEQLTEQCHDKSKVRMPGIFNTEKLSYSVAPRVVGSQSDCRLCLRETLDTVEQERN